MSGSTKIVGIGAGGHAKILVEMIEEIGKYEIIGFTDRDPQKIGTTHKGYPVLGSERKLVELYNAGVRNAFIGVGAVSSAGTRLRAELFRQATKLGFQMVTLVHPRAMVSPSATIGVGSVVMAGAVIGTGTHVGGNVTVYAGAVVEHDSTIGDHVHLSPGVLIAGGVHVGEGTFLGIGASMIHGIKVGAWTTIGAGAVVLHEIPDHCVAVGIPARVVAKR